MEVMPFWSKSTPHSAWCGQVHLLITHPEVGKHVEKILQKKKSTVAGSSHSQQCQLLLIKLEMSILQGAHPLEDNSSF